MTITISGANATSDLTINAPTGATQFPAYFLDLIDSNDLAGTPGVISIAFPTTATGFNLTSFGRTDDADGFPGTVWRLRNGEDDPTTGTLTGYGSGFSNTYDLAANTDTFVFSSFSNGAATHILLVDSNRITKAASNNLFRDKDEDSIGGDSYKIIGGSGDDSLVGANLDDIIHGNDGNDTLRGGRGEDNLKGGRGRDLLVGNRDNDLLEGEAGNDRLVGRLGNDTLTGGMGRDRFRFTNQGIDTVTDFSLADGDIFQIRSNSYTNAPSPSTTAVANIVGVSGVNIYVDTFANIGSAPSSNVYFAYTTDTNELLYDQDGDWSSGSEIIATTNNFGIPGNANFDFF